MSIAHNMYAFFRIRNSLQLECLGNRHSYKEEMVPNVDNGCIEMTITIGGELLGNITTKYIYGDNNLSDILEEFIKSTNTLYRKNKSNIPPDYENQKQ